MRDAAPDPTLLAPLESYDEEAVGAGKDAAQPLLLWPDEPDTLPDLTPNPLSHKERGQQANDESIGLQRPETPQRSLSRDSLRAMGAFSTNAEGNPDTGVPAQAEERPTAELEMWPAGNYTRTLPCGSAAFYWAVAAQAA